MVTPRFSFNDSVSESLYSQTYHHQLIKRIDQELSQRNERTDSPAGGALVTIAQGDVHVCWVSREKAEGVKSAHQHAQALDKLKSEYAKDSGAVKGKQLYSRATLRCLGFFSRHPRRITSRAILEYLWWVKRHVRGGMQFVSSQINIRSMQVDSHASLTVSQAFPSSQRTEKRISPVLQKATRPKSSPLLITAALWSHQFCVSYQSVVLRACRKRI